MTDDNSDCVACEESQALLIESSKTVIRFPRVVRTIETAGIGLHARLGVVPRPIYECRFDDEGDRPTVRESYRSRIVGMDMDDLEMAFEIGQTPVSAQPGAGVWHPHSVLRMAA